MRLLTVIMAVFISSQAFGLTEGLTSQKRHFSSGGASPEEREEMYADIETHLLWMEYANKSGEYLALVKVAIWSADGQKILETVTEGPWLFVDLNDGTYRVDSTIDGQTISRKVTVKYRPKVLAKKITLHFN